MNRQTKLKLVESLNNEFEKLLSNKERAKYGSYMRAINEEVIEKAPRTKKEINDIVKKYKIDTKVAAKMFTVLSGVENHLLNDPTKKSRELLKPLEQIMRVYSVKSPKTFAKGIYDMTAGRNTSERSKQFKPALLSYYSGFTENIESLEKQNQRALQRTEVDKVSEVFRDLEDLREARVSIRQAKKMLIDKYNDPKRVTTALNTELHEQAERTKLEQSKFMGFTHKRWNTQGDERVRRTAFHNTVKSKTIPIDSDFKGGGQSADYPGDVSLNVGERVNCRCYITYHNSPQATISSRTIIAPPPPKKVAEKGPVNADPILIEKSKEKYERIDFATIRGKTKDLTSVINAKIEFEEKELPILIEGMQFDRPPKIITEDTLKKNLINNKGLLVVRGYAATTEERLNFFRKNMEEGDFYIDNSGGAMFGRGMYSAVSMTNEDTTGWSEEGMSTALKYATTDEEESYGQIDVMYIPNTFKIMSRADEKRFKEGKILEALINDKNEEVSKYGELTKKINVLEEKINQLTGQEPQEEANSLIIPIRKLRKERMLYVNEDAVVDAKILYQAKYNFQDASITALHNGFDGYFAADNDYLVILNRSKVELLDNGGEFPRHTQTKVNDLLFEVGVEREKLEE